MTNQINPASEVNQRNYEIDFLKMIFALFVFVSHTECFIGENTGFSIPIMLGQVSVHFFFIISGVFMVNTITEKAVISHDIGYASFSFVIKKFKKIALYYWISFFLYLQVYNWVNGFNSFGKSLLKIFPEAFLLTTSGLWIEYNISAWYISAMFICMLPLAYMLLKNRSFYIYVFAPLVAILTIAMMTMFTIFIIVVYCV